ncbi:MAG TPA: protein-L-isoaspartate O-methyltransferase [Anaerolineae bacterium]|nr:protein-L-isoaspartate O-methyltransferase [Anaerolineae bacterium]
MRGWILPPPIEPIKTKQQFEAERVAKVTWLIQHEFLKSDRIKDALLKVPREDFIPENYRDYAYLEVPFPLPGERATISCPHSYPLFYEPLGLDRGDRFLEIGLGSGYGAAIAREVVGPEGLVVSIEIDPLTFEYAKGNLERAGYSDIVLVNGDGGLGHPEFSPFDKIAITAACVAIPPPLIDQLKIGGRLISPVIKADVQDLVLYEKDSEGVQRLTICEVLYVSLRGIYGA